jgi:hypothetical protein
MFHVELRDIAGVQRSKKKPLVCKGEAFEFYAGNKKLCI